MCVDNDIKIAGDRPSEDIKRRNSVSAPTGTVDAKLKKKAIIIGQEVAGLFAEDAENFVTDNSNGELVHQRRLLLSFTVTVGFEKFIGDDTLAGFAQKSFLDSLKKFGDEIYRLSSDTGAFSFYYLAYRRGGDVERRIGQTFAMLCSHDGDPIFQELGEALYCWFTSEIRKTISKHISCNA